MQIFREMNYSAFSASVETSSVRLYSLSANNCVRSTFICR